MFQRKPRDISDRYLQKFQKQSNCHIINLKHGIKISNRKPVTLCGKNNRINLEN